VVPNEVRIRIPKGEKEERNSASASFTQRLNGLYSLYLFAIIKYDERRTMAFSTRVELPYNSQLPLPDVL
jgi:hypothetical protein